MSAVSQCTADGMHGPREHWESTSGIAVTSARTHRAVERSSRRAPVTVRSIETPSRKLSLPDVVGRRGRSIVPTVRSSQSTGKGVQRGGEGTEETPNGAALHVSVRGVRQWPDDGNSWINRTGRGRDGVAARVSQEAHLGTGRGSFPRDVEHSRDPPEREAGTHSDTIQDVRTRSCSPRGCTEHHQTGTHSTQSSSTPQGHRAGRPSTADEQRAKNSESTRAVPQENGGQIRLGDEIDIYEAESLAMWGFGGRRGLPMSLSSPSRLRLHPVEQFFCSSRISFQLQESYVGWPSVLTATSFVVILS